MFANRLLVAAALVAGSTALTATARAAEASADAEIVGLALIDHPMADDSTVWAREAESRGRGNQPADDRGRRRGRGR